jgi:hypothetical protein
MPRYYFNIALSTRVIIDSTGKELAGLEAAHWHAVRLAYQARAHLPDDDEPWVIRIEDETRFTQEIYVPCFRGLASSKRANGLLTTRAVR